MNRIRKLRLALLGAFLALPLIFGPIGIVAAAVDGVAVVVDDASQFVITAPMWTFITGLVLPFVVALVTKASASSTFKGVVGIVLAAVAAIVERATLTDGTAVFTSALFLDILFVYGPQLLTYLGVWKPFNLNAKVLPSKGFG